MNEQQLIDLISANGTVSDDAQKRLLNGDQIQITLPLLTAIVNAAIASIEPVAAPTDISAELRKHAGNLWSGYRESADVMRRAADECERFYGGMMAWKQTAETKDRKLGEEIEARITERINARLAAPDLSSIEPNLILCAEDEENLAWSSASEFARDYASENMNAIGSACEFDLTCGVKLPSRKIRIKREVDRENDDESIITWEWVK